MSDSVVPTARQPLAKTLGQLWGCLFLLALFGMGGYRLLLKGIQIWQDHPPVELWEYLIYGFLIIFGTGKAEFLFRRIFIPRTLARGREALGETGWSGDYWLAPFCMLSFYRPWQKKHQIMSFVLVPVMVGLAVYFALGEINPVLKGSVDIAIGFALAYAALVFALYLGLLLVWWLGGANEATHPWPKWLGAKWKATPTAE